MAFFTRAAVAGVTRLVLLMTCETVAVDTPAIRATSCRVGIEKFPSIRRFHSEGEVLISSYERLNDVLTVFASISICTFKNKAIGKPDLMRVVRRKHFTAQQAHMCLKCRDDWLAWTHEFVV